MPGEEEALICPAVDLPHQKYDRLGPYFYWGCRSKMRRRRMVLMPDDGNYRAYCPSCIGNLYASETPIEEISP